MLQGARRERGSCVPVLPRCGHARGTNVSRPPVVRVIDRVLVDATRRRGGDEPVMSYKDPNMADPDAAGAEEDEVPFPEVTSLPDPLVAVLACEVELRRG